MCIFLSYYISLLCKVVNTTLYHDLFSFRKKLIARAAFLRHVISMQFFPLCARNNSKYRIITNFLTIRYLMMRLRLQVLLSRSITYIFSFFFYRKYYHASYAVKSNDLSRSRFPLLSLSLRFCDSSSLSVLITLSIPREVHVYILRQTAWWSWLYASNSMRRYSTDVISKKWKLILPISKFHYQRKKWIMYWAI